MKKKILFIHNFYPIIHGAARIGDTIYTNDEIKINFDTKFINTGLSSGSNEIGKFHIAKLLKFLKVLILLFYYRVFYNPDIYYTNFELQGNGMFLDYFRQLFVPKKKKIIHIHNKLNLKTKNNWIKYYVIKQSLKDSSIIVLSESLKSQFCDIKYKSIHVLSNGIEDSYDKKLKLSDDDSVKVLYCSNLFKYKGVFDLIKVVEILKKRKFEVELTIIGNEGDISFKKLTKHIVDSNLGDNIRLLGPLYGESKYIEFSKNNVFLYPSYYDSFPLVLLESLSFGIPIITYDIGGISDIVDDNDCGFVLKKGATEGLSEKLLHYIKDKDLLTKHSINARKKFESNYTLSVFTSNFIKILDNYN
tara:strand:+ start:137 stop:1216 length:1080 start_codon:yes stop_codon:yes gene_type:complete